jgi:hypothetical protein
LAAAGKIKIGAIIASLAGLALVLSPTFSMLQVPGAETTGADRFPEDADFIDDDTVVENVSENDLTACGSVNESVRELLGVVNGTIDNRKVASDKLVAEFCSRPVLIHEIASTDYASLSLVAYACDASSGKIGTLAMQDSLSDYSHIYCDSARQLIISETNTFLQSVEEFRTEYLPLFEAGLEENESEGNNNDTISFDDNSVNDDSNSAQDQEESSQNFSTTSVEITLDEVTQSLEECLALVDAGEYYPAAKSFDNASKKFIALFQEGADL